MLLEEIINTAKKYINIKALLKSTQILIDKIGNGDLLILTDEESSEYINGIQTVKLDKTYTQNDHDYAKLKQLIHLIYELDTHLNLIPDMHSDYEFVMGYNKINDNIMSEILTKTQIEKLYNKGYKIIKTIEE